MPKELHDKLVRHANKKGLKGKRKKAYVFGTLDKIQKNKDKELDSFVARFNKKR